MKLLSNEIDPFSHSGSVKLEINDEINDMPSLESLLEVGDKVYYETMRMTKVDGRDGKEKKQSLLKIGIRVERINYDDRIDTMRINGKTFAPTKHVPMGQNHTIEIINGVCFTLSKDWWDPQRLEIIEEFCNPLTSGDIAVVVMHEGLAHVCLVQKTKTSTLAIIQQSIPSKSTHQANYEKAMNKFFSDIYKAICRGYDLDALRNILIGSPGFLAEEFFTFLTARFVREDHRPLITNAYKVQVVHCSSGHKHAVDEILADPNVISLLGDSAAVEESKIFTELEETLLNNPDQACYGIKPVQYAAENGFVSTLLITQGLLQNSDVETRERFDFIIQSVREHGGSVVKFSSLRGTGERLDGLTGIAAILRLPIPNIEEIARTVYPES